MTSSTITQLTVSRFWEQFRREAGALLDHPDPHVRWREHRQVGRAFAIRVRRLGAPLIARDVPTGFRDALAPKTTAVFDLLDDRSDAALTRWAGEYAAKLRRRAMRLKN